MDLVSSFRFQVSSQVIQSELTTEDTEKRINPSSAGPFSLIVLLGVLSGNPAFAIKSNAMLRSTTFEFQFISVLHV